MCEVGDGVSEEVTDVSVATSASLSLASFSLRSSTSNTRRGPCRYSVLYTLPGERGGGGEGDQVLRTPSSDHVCYASMLHIHVCMYVCTPSYTYSQPHICI